MNVKRRTSSETRHEETALWFGRNDEIFGMYHAAEGNIVVVFCPPFAEEHKSAYRTFVETARALAAAGVACLRFDYFGTGDSDGTFAEFLPSRAMEDIVSAAEQARKLCGSSRVVLLGLRLGGTMALGAAPRAEAESVILWQPVASGKAFFDLTIRQQMLRRQLIEKTGTDNFFHGSKEGYLSPSYGDVIDLDGFPLSAAAAEEIKQLDCVKAADAFPGPVRLLQISYAEAMSRDYRPLADALGDRLTFAAVRCEPFWNRIDLTDASPVIRQTLGWLAGAENEDK